MTLPNYSSTPRDWKNRSSNPPPTGFRHTSQPYSRMLASPNLSLLRPHLSAGGVDKLRKLEVTPRKQADLSKLIRYRGFVPPHFPIQNSSYSFPLYTYYRSICVLGQPNVAHCLMGLLTIIGRKATKLGITLSYIDDFIRSHLLLISKTWFLDVFDKSPAYMFFLHLASLGGKAPYTKQQIRDDISSWISYKPPFPHTDFIQTQMKYLFSRFKPKPPGHYLPFSAFCDDPLLWATSGGAPKTTIEGKEYRNKWAWAFGNKISSCKWNSVDLYSLACSYPNVCKVALKEEPTKTREVITTPMASYLRQSYLVYRWGKLKIHSPIGSGSFMTKFQSIQHHYYCSLDGDRFDQCVPAEFILDVINRLGDLDDECRRVADAELASMKSLYIEWDGTRYRWLGGILSGWRLTSLIGSMLSYIIGTYIIIKLNLSGVCDLAVLGDDIILYSSTPIDRELAVYYYNDFGMQANLRKTASGTVGEFLRKTYSPLGVLAYPALAARSIFFASPWLSSYLANKYTDLTQNWLTFYSRLLPFRTNDNIHTFIYNHILNDLTKAFGPNPLYPRFLRTPISVGGGGCSEWDSGSYAIIRPSPPSDSHTPLKRFLSVFGIHDSLKLVRAGDIVPIRNKTTFELASSPALSEIFKLPDNVPVSQPIVTWFLDESIPATHISKMLNIILPRGLRVAGKAAILSELLGQISAPSGLTSVQATPESLMPYVKITRSLTLSRTNLGSSPSNRNLNLSVYIHNLSNYSDVRVTYGTW